MNSTIDYPDVSMNLVRPKQPVIGTVISNDMCLRGKSASFVRHTVIDVANTPLAGCFRAGQSFGVIAPGTDEQGKPHKVRLYSIACPSWGEDGAGQHISTTPKRLIDEFVPQSDQDDELDHSLFLGECSNYLCDLRAGDPVALSGPQGKRFLLPKDVDSYDYLFLATGTGIAPFRGMVMELLSAPNGPCRSRVELIMGAPYSTDLLYDAQFQNLARSHANFRYHTAISRESNPQYVSSLLQNNMQDFAGMLGSRRTLIYICGLEGMEKGVYTVLAEHNVATGFFDESGDVVKPTERCKLEVY